MKRDHEKNDAKRRSSTYVTAAIVGNKKAIIGLANGIGCPQ
jgi:hypothetical protein